MKIERKTFSGVMNLDDGNDIIPQTHHKEARNIVFRGNGANKEAQTVVGNRLISNSLPTGTNSCVGAFYDQQDKRLFYFNYNSNGNHGIYIYNTIAKTVTRLFLSNTDSATDILGFSINNPITSINMVYGNTYNSTLDIDGDILYWVDSLGRPSKINVDRKLANKYSVYKRSYLDVAKAPPVMPIKCSYENDNNVTVNNLNNKLFQFIYRFVYDDNEKSVWSSGSIVPLPLFSEDISVTTDPKKNSRINLYYSTGDETIRKIEIAVRSAHDGIVGDYELATTIDKSTITGPSNVNDIAWNYLFYNNNVLTPIDQSEIVQLFDYVPQSANAQELLNGNTLIYGGITEGYNLVKDSNFGYTTNTTNGFNYVNGILFFAEQAGVSSCGDSTTIRVYLSGCGTNDSVTNIPTSITAGNGATFVILLRNDSTNTVTTISYASSTTTISTILNGLASSATSAGLTATVTGNVLTISEPGIAKQLHSSYVNQDNSTSAFSTLYKKNVLFAHKPSANYKYGVVYYDEKGRTNGVVSNESVRVVTPRFNNSNNYPYVNIQIGGVPPVWASYYHIVRTDNLTYEKSLRWVTNRAFYNHITYADSPTDSYNAYLGIGNMIDYNDDIKSTSGYVSYDYTPGDRVRFLANISSTGVKNNFSSGDFYDFEVIGVESNPNINGYIAYGTYIKIKWSNTSVGTYFNFFKATDTGVVTPTILVAEDYQNYEIEIYNSKQTSGESDVYYEIGEQYAIGLPGTANRFHVGKNVSQKYTPSLQFAESIINTGDCFYRYRNVPIGTKYNFAGGPYTQNDSSAVHALQYSTVVINVWESNNTPKTISTTNYDIKSQVIPASSCSLVATDYPNNLTADSIFYNKSSSAMTIRVRGELKASTITAKNQYVVMHAKVVNSGGATIQTIIPRSSISTTNDEYSIPFDAKILVPASSKLFLMTECQNASGNGLLVGAFNLQLDIINNVNISVIESSFSDVNKIQLNCNSRPVIYDKNARQGYYSTMVRYSMPKVAGTSVNELSRFYPQNVDEYDRQRGDIRRLKVRGGQMRVFQDRGCGAVGVLEKMMFNADGSNNLIQTNKLINQIHYYLGDYGMGWSNTSLTSSSNADYFVDPIRGYHVRLSNDGFTPISETSKAQYYITSLANKYATPVSGTLGGYAKILGAYDFYEEEYVSVFQGYSGQSNTTIAYSEKENRYSAFYDYAPEWITSAEGSMISFKNGGLYLHDNTSNYANFYGVQYNPSIKLVFNDMPTVKKRYNTITMLANKVWSPDYSGDISTNLGQISSLQSGDFTIRDGKIHAAFKRDENSVGGLYNGDVLKGNWAEINMRPVNGNEFVNLYYIELSILEPFYNR